MAVLRALRHTRAQGFRSGLWIGGFRYPYLFLGGDSVLGGRSDARSDILFRA